MNETPSREHPLKIALYTIVMGILIGWIFALAIPVAIEEEISASTVNRLPVYGFVAGAMLGLGMCLVSRIRDMVFVVLSGVVCGAIFWFFSVLLVRGVLLLVEVPEDTVDAISEWVGPIAFATGPVLGLCGALLIGFDKLDGLRGRTRSERTKVPRKQ